MPVHVSSLSCAWLLTRASGSSSPPVVSAKAAELSGWVRFAGIPVPFAPRNRSHPHLDGFHRVPIERLRAAAAAGTGEGADADPDRLDALTHYTCPSLPHLIALLCRPTASSIPPGTALVVVDSLSALLNHAFPKLPETRPARDAKGSRGMLAACNMSDRIKCLKLMSTSRTFGLGAAAPGAPVHCQQPPEARGHPRPGRCGSHAMRHQDAGGTRRHAYPGHQRRRLGAGNVNQARPVP